MYKHLTFIAITALLLPLCARGQVFDDSWASTELATPPSATPIGAVPSATPSGSAYSSTIYEPFTEDEPSANYSPSEPQRVQGRRGLGNFDDMPDGGEQDENWPVGEPLSLFIMAAAFAAILYCRKRKADKA